MGRLGRLEFHPLLANKRHEWKRCNYRKITPANPISAHLFCYHMIIK